MNSTLTIRLPEDRRQALKRLAASLGKSESDLVRQMIERGLSEESLGTRLAHLKGSLPASPPADDALARSLRQHNWRS